MLNIAIYDTSGTIWQNAQQKQQKGATCFAALMQKKLKVESISTFY